MSQGDLILPQELQRALQPIAALCRRMGCEAWLVGGSVRDLLFGRPIHDIDLAVARGALELARALADATGGAFVLLDEDHNTARTIMRLEDASVTIDWAELRAASLEGDLALRDVTINAMAAPVSLMAAQGVLAPAALVDPLGGRRDLAARLLRPCAPTMVRNDPLRAMRALRLAAELGFSLAPELEELLARDGLLITTVAAERVRDELLKLLATRHSAVFLRYLDSLGLLVALLPELAELQGANQPSSHFLGVFEHSLEAVCAGEWVLAQLEGFGEAVLALPAARPADHFPPSFFARPETLRHVPDLALQTPYAARLVEHFDRELGAGHPRRALWKLALLLHDIAKPRTRQATPEGGISFHGHQDVGAEMARVMAERLRLSRAEVAYVGAVVAEHMRPGQLAALDELSPRAIYRFFRDTGDAGPDILLHALADHMAARGPRMTHKTWGDHVAWTNAMLHALYERAEVVRPVRLVDGHALIARLGLAPGPEVGRLLEQLAEAQAAGEVRTLEEAIELAKRLS